MSPANWSIIAAILGGSFGAALVSLIQFLISRKDRKDGQNNEITTALAGVKSELDTLRNEIAEDRATDARIRILSFSDEVRHNVRHSKESFDQINLDIDTYRRYCDGHPDYKNNRAVMAIANIERVYADCLRKQDFLE